MRLADSLPQQRLAQLRRLRRRALKCRPLRYSQAPRRKRAKALFRRHPGARSVRRATTQRRLSCASRCCCDIVSIRDKQPLVPIQDDVASASVGRCCAALESSPEERSASGSLRACLSERSEFAGPPLARVPQRGGCAAALVDRISDRGEAASHFSARRLGSAATPNTCARDVAKTSYTRSAF
jgi:hypothetical protein